MSRQETNDRSSTTAAKWWATIKRLVAVTGVVAITGGAGFVASVAVPSTARADITGLQSSRSSSDTGTIRGTVNGQGWGGPTSLQSVAGAGGRAAQAYCLDLNKWGDNTIASSQYSSSSFSTAGIPAPEKVAWIVNNSYPTVSPEELAKKVGGSFSFGLSAKEAVMATQAAIWNITNNFQADTADPINMGIFENWGVNKNDVLSVYNWLLEQVKSGKSIASVPADPISIDNSKATMTSAGLYGPLTITANGAASVSIALVGAEIMVNNASVGISANITAGQQFFIKTTSTAMTSITITASAVTKMATGTILIPQNPKDQPLVVAQGYVFTTTVKITLTTSGPAPTPVPTPNPGGGTNDNGGITPDKPGPNQPPADKTNPALAITVTIHDTNANAVAELNEKLVFNYVVTNTGNTVVENVLVDSAFLSQSKVSIVCQQTTLKPGEKTTCTSREYAVIAKDVSAGKILESATARGSVSGAVVTSAAANASIITKTGNTAEEESLMKLKKSAALQDTNGDGKAGTGEKIVYSFELNNPGKADIAGIKINDQMLENAKVAINCPSQVLKAGQTMVCQSAAYTVTETDRLAGKVKNVATASYNGGKTTTAPAEATVETLVDTKTTTDSGGQTRKPSSNTNLANTGGAEFPLVGLAALLVGGAVLIGRRRKN